MEPQLKSSDAMKRLTEALQERLLAAVLVCGTDLNAQHLQYGAQCIRRCFLTFSMRFRR
ncbi:Protein of unknown function [Pyronema omphalodes CBS 100304]|uniref:Uncharacterized protein n=1 Tax=Pyronema omphalodes (strain CBS 100304) TaxID=1076935 RepID=U4LQZ0_PYROM|nr:Protein of unknown function [Pyronema omphalodes CBS 100304]